MFFVAKKDSTIRLITHYQALNAVIVKKQYPLMLIDDLFYTLSGAIIFNKIALTAGYNQVFIASGDEPKTTFHTQYGSFLCQIMNFMMTNASSAFATLMNKTFKELVRKCVVIYLVDIIVFSKPREEHKEHLLQNPNALRKHQLVAKPLN